MIRTLVIFAAAALLFVPVAHAAEGHKHGIEAEPPREAVCVIAPTQGNQTGGTLMLTQNKGSVQITGRVTGLTPGAHGFHIHEYGDLTAPDGKSAGAHFDPKGHHKHGGPTSRERHAGDLGNIQADDKGVAKVNIRADGLDLHFVIGRSMVVHANEDDLKTDPSGNSGARIGVGVIGIAAPRAMTKR